MATTKFGYKFSNLCGTVYKQGNTVFTPDGNCVISPVGNRVTIFDLVNNRSSTLPFENRRNIAVIALSPDGTTLITIDEEGHSLLINFVKRVVLHQFNFKARVVCAKFSPNSKFLAVSNGKQVHVWRTPQVKSKEFAPFALHRRYTGHYDAVTTIGWSSDGKFFAAGSRDTTVRVYSLDPIEGYRPVTLTAHRDRIIGCFFAEDSHDLYSVSRDGTLLRWKSRQEEVQASELASSSSSSSSSSDSSDGEAEDSPRPSGKRKRRAYTVTKYRWSLSPEDKHYFLQNHAKVVSCAFHASSSILVVGFTTGIFALYELPDFSTIHTLSISQKRISSVSISPSGEWLAFGCARLGQLLVWEWQSESYVLKQQGHFYDMNVLAYSPDGQTVVTGGDDSKVKLWNTTTGFCFVTFKEHTGGITGVEFVQSGMAVLSCSLDGTVRAFDLLRYKNFRTFTSPHPAQFSSLSVDSSGEIVCAGSLDEFEIFLWSMQTGHLLNVLAGHEGPLSGTAFNPAKNIMASGSWDRTVRMWDVYNTGSAVDTLEHSSDVVAIAFRPDGIELSVSTMNGQIAIWDVTTSRQVGLIDGKKDIAGGRKDNDAMTAKNSSAGKFFNSLCYTADGSCILAGSSTRYVCIYEVSQRVLLKQFSISNNLSMDGMKQFLNSKNMTEAGPLALIDNDDSDSDVEMRLDHSLPGVSKGDHSSRSTRPEIRCKAVRFSPNGRSWAAASTEGLCVFSLDDGFVFDPFDLDVDVTPENVRKIIQEGNFTKALVVACRLNDPDTLHEAIESTPLASIHLTCYMLPTVHVATVLTAVATQLETSRHIEYYLTWCRNLFDCHGSHMKSSSSTFVPVLRTAQKALLRRYESLRALCDDNKYGLQYLLHRLQAQPQLTADDEASKEA